MSLFRTTCLGIRNALVHTIVASIFLATAPLAIAGGDEDPVGTYWESRGWFLDNYRIGITRIPDVGQSVVFVAVYDEVLFSGTDNQWSIYTEFNSHIALGDDITGDGIPNLVLQSYSGGAHCCLTLWLFEAGERFRLVGAYGGGDYPVRFRQLDDEPGMEMIQFENAFAYWYVGFASAPAPQVYFRWQGEDYVPAPDLMRLPPPEQNELQDIAATYQDHEQWQKKWTDDRMPVPTAFLGVLLDLTYSGNLEAANELLTMTWPADLEGRDAFRYEFFCQLQRANFWDIVAPLNGLEAAPPADDCPDDARWR